MPSLLPCGVWWHPLGTASNPSLWKYPQWATLGWMSLREKINRPHETPHLVWLRFLTSFIQIQRPDEDLCSTNWWTSPRTSHCFPCAFNTSLTWGRESRQTKATLKGTVCISLPKHFLILQILWARWLLSHDLNSCLEVEEEEENVSPEQIHPKSSRELRLIAQPGCNRQGLLVHGFHTLAEVKILFWQANN